MTPTDNDLIARSLLADDRPAFGELVRRHQSAVRRFLRHLTRGDHALADDLAQETFTHAWHSLRRFHGGSTFSTWLLGIAHNLWRNARRQQRADEPLTDTNVEQAAVAATAMESDLRHDLDRALGQLSEPEQTAVHLAYQQGLSHQEISDLLGWPLGTVKTHLARSKEKLRHLLAAWNPQT